MSLDGRISGPGGGHGHAVVIGGSFAGLTAARALANFMDRVTVIERDWVPSGPGRRRGVPQARHTHTLTTAAQHGLEQLFPGITENLTDAGAERIRMPLDMLLLGPAGWLSRFDSGLSVLSAGRDLIDAVLRDRLRTDPKVAFLSQHEAVALEPGPQDTVTGVWVRERDRKAPDGLGARRLVPADFVVDASGQGSRAPEWLAQLGYRPPRETVVASPTTCATALLAPPVGHFSDWKSLLLMASPDNPGQGMLHPVERGHWSVTVCAGDGSRPPTDREGLLRAAGALRHPLLSEVVEAATLLGPVYGWGRTEHRWRHYEELRRWPDQFLVVGDALATFDPVHGQGMTSAVECALVLDQLLISHGTAVGLGHRLRQAVAHRLSPLWRLSTHRLVTAGGGTGRPPGLRARIGSRYTARIAAAATTDPYAATLLLRQLQTAAPPAGPLRPAVLLAALRGPRGEVSLPSSTHGAAALGRRSGTPVPPVYGPPPGRRPRPRAGRDAAVPFTSGTGSAPEL
ncbi:FAD-dependent oxidoreductase [Streptomyces sp. enrichment culture]|uniref:FAD-dependent oxidoreductase n=1 Tax=Streptomyces sp. enrichment culture TaxID=1795815 RepID=UPI003F54984B